MFNKSTVTNFLMMTRASKMRLLQEVRKSKHLAVPRRSKVCGELSPDPKTRRLWRKKLPRRGMRGRGFSGKARAPSEQEGEGKQGRDTEQRGL